MYKSKKINYIGEDAAQKFIETLCELTEDINRVKMILSEDKAKKCHICNEKFVDGDKNLFYRNV